MEENVKNEESWNLKIGIDPAKRTNHDMNTEDINYANCIHWTDSSINEGADNWRISQSKSKKKSSSDKEETRNTNKMKGFATFIFIAVISGNIMLRFQHIFVLKPFLFGSTAKSFRTHKLMLIAERNIFWVYSKDGKKCQLCYSNTRLLVGKDSVVGRQILLNISS